MKEEIKDRWVEALRSGKYQQGQGTLKYGESFCCLGVLCDLHAKETGVDWEYDPRRNAQKYLGNTGVPPVKVHSWAGIRHKANEVLTNLNDARGYTFEQIADWIEENWERL